MKPIKAGDTATDGAAAAPPSFLDSLKTIDVSSLDRLIAIRQEHARIAEYRAKAEEKKKEVAEAVYARVAQDYAKRATAIEQQSAPLRSQARAEYRKLRALLDALGVRHEQAQLQKDELQFRHTVGELTDAELAEKLVDPQRVLDQCASDRQELDASKARFVEALGSEEALEASEPVAAAAPPPAPEPPAPQPAAAQKEPAASAPVPPPAAAPKPTPVAAAPQAPPAAPDLEDAGATRVARVIPDLDHATRMVGPSPAAAPPPSRPAPTDADVADGATVMLASAALVVEDPTGAKEYPLTVFNGIGRADENRICLSSPGISRKHAVITAGAGGFTIKDLGSQNGTFVNGQRVTEKRLAEGDTIDVGSVKFAFRTPWPLRTGAAAARSGAATQGKR
jgi:hypothetical protein